MIPTQLRLLLLGALLASCAAPEPGALSDSSTGDFTRTRAHTTPLDWTVGEWVGTRRATDDGVADSLRVRVTPLLGGAGQLRELWVEHDGGVYRGMSIQLHETKTGEWTRYYANDVHGKLVTLRGAGGPDAAPTRWHSGPNESGRWSENRTERPDEDTWISTVSRTADGGRTWQVLFVDELERVAPEELAR